MEFVIDHGLRVGTIRWRPSVNASDLGDTGVAPALAEMYQPYVGSLVRSRRSFLCRTIEQGERATLGVGVHAHWVTKRRTHVLHVRTARGVLVADALSREEAVDLAMTHLSRGAVCCFATESPVTVDGIELRRAAVAVCDGYAVELMPPRLAAAGIGTFGLNPDEASLMLELLRSSETVTYDDLAERCARPGARKVLERIVRRASTERFALPLHAGRRGAWFLPLPAPWVSTPVTLKPVRLKGSGINQCYRGWISSVTIGDGTVKVALTGEPRTLAGTLVAPRDDTVPWTLHVTPLKRSVPVRSGPCEDATGAATVIHHIVSRWQQSQ